MTKINLSKLSHPILFINDIHKIKGKSNGVIIQFTTCFDDIKKTYTVSKSDNRDVLLIYQFKSHQSIKRDQIQHASEPRLSEQKLTSKVSVLTLNTANKKLNKCYMDKLISQLKGRDVVTMDKQGLKKFTRKNETLVGRIATRFDIDDGRDTDTLLRILFCVPKSSNSAAPYTQADQVEQSLQVSQPPIIGIPSMPYTRPGGQKYIYIPFIDGERVLKRLVPLNMKRVQQGKLMFLPVFKDQQQITKFRRILALTHLDPLLQYLTTLSQTDLSTLDSTNTLYISAHGVPGEHYAYDVKQKRISARDLAFDLNSMGLKPEVSIKIAACYSGEGDRQGILIPANLNDEQAFDYVVNHMGAFEHSLAGAFEKELMDLQPTRVAGIVYGTIGAHVLTPSVSVKTEKISSGKLRLNTGRAGAFFDVIGTRAQSYQFKVRKSDMKRGAGLDPSR